MPKIVSGGRGERALKTPELFGNVVRAAVEAAHVPVTVKIRAGWDENSINAVEIAKIAEQSGAAAVAVHGRTKTQLYAGKADWDVIRAREAVGEHSGHRQRRRIHPGALQGNVRIHRLPTL